MPAKLQPMSREEIVAFTRRVAARLPAIKRRPSMVDPQLEHALTQLQKQLEEALQELEKERAPVPGKKTRVSRKRGRKAHGPMRREIA